MGSAASEHGGNNHACGCLGKIENVFLLVFASIPNFLQKNANLKGQ